VADLSASRNAFERTKKSVGGGVSSGLRAAVQPHPLFVDKAAGSHVWDTSGNDFVDYVMGWGPLIAGHSHPEIVARVSEMVPRMQMVGMGHELEYLAAEAVLQAVPGTERLLWSNTGTEAVQVALRLARAATGRNAVVKFVRSYHGWHDSVFASVRSHSGGQRPTLDSRGQNPHAVEDLIVAEFNDTTAVAQLLDQARERDIAAVLIDPVQSNSGLFEPEDGFLEMLRTKCDEQGVVLIFDQVIAGFRVARGGATELYGVVPDLSVLGKAVAGGFSQAAVAGRADLIDSVTDGVVHAGTYNGNPIALAAVQATMEVVAEPGVYDRMNATAEHLRSQLLEVLADAPGAFEIRHVGAMLAIDDKEGTGPGALWPRLTGELLAQGIVALPSGKIFLSTAHTESDSERFASALRRCLTAVGV
jgi:glutamate-1-semialdehyde 2,1-aminomutase